MGILIQSNNDALSILFKTNPQISKDIDDLIKSLSIFSLKTIFVLADEDYRVFIETHSKILGYDSGEISEGNFGLTLSKYINAGEIEQIIYIHCSVFCLYLNDRYPGLITVPSAMKEYSDLLYHEIGHTLCNQFMFDKYRYHQDTNSFLSIKTYDELFEYSKIEMITIWGEYFAQRTALQIAPCAIQKTTSAFESALNDDATELFEYSYFIYRILYFWSHYIAFFHHRSINVPDSAQILCQYEQTHLSDLLLFFSEKLKYVFENRQNCNVLKETEILAKTFFDCIKAHYPEE